ncbi:hypothetical protein GWI33_003475 [Rhynchophorus ferrugineus]|uniref:Uncharacterized protein n=1 Tax=Rhynchophorus ferrugineus TaxID=354439 RepID=A0A834HME0_RHYFE|nr:hypothetical protein GWI33_003475 [Rhynchophorus ferrugineus]
MSTEAGECSGRPKE